MAVFKIQGIVAVLFLIFSQKCKKMIFQKTMSSRESWYLSEAKTLQKAAVKWKELAKIDGKLMSKWVDNENGKCHKIITQDQFPVNENAIEVEKFLDEEYSKSMNTVQYKPVSYLPSDTFLQLGLFAKEDIPKGSVIEGVAGFLAEIGDDEIVNGYNDVSILYSRLRNTQWMMLGPVSFINAACKSNVEYRQKNKIVYCIATKDISMDQELTVFYHRHYFGLFNAEYLCPFKTEHGDPFPYISKSFSSILNSVCLMYPSIVLLTDVSHKQIKFPQKRKMVARVCNDFKHNQKTIEGLKVIEESLRRANKYDVQKDAFSEKHV